MFKLLTEESRQKVTREYGVRRIIVIFMSLIVVFVIGIIGLLPSYILSNARQDDVLEWARITGSTGQDRDVLDLQAWLTEINLRLQTLSPELDTDRPSDLVKKILDQKIAGVDITSLSWIKSKDKKIVLSVSGTALDRQILVAFQNRINTSGYFSEVVLPISNLVRDRDIDFQIKFSPATSTQSLQTP